MKTVDRTMSAQQQVTDEGTRPGKSHNGASESKLNLTLLDRRRRERWETRRGQRTTCSEASSKRQNETARRCSEVGKKWVKSVTKPVDVIR